MKRYKWPEIKGKLDIYPEIIDGNQIKVTIIGDPKGLISLAELLRTLALFDQNKNDDPIGEREHVHLRSNLQLGYHSCEVELCRADAKGTGQLPEFME